MRKMLGVCSYFVIASGTSTTQVRAISDHIREKLREREEKLWHVEGEREASWLLLDYGDVVAHIFLEPTRRYYDLEKLWSGAPQDDFKDRPMSAGKKKKQVVRKKKKKILRKKKKRSQK